MPTAKQNMGEAVDPGHGMGKASQQRMQGIYAASPIYTGDLTDDSITSEFQAEVMDGVRPAGFLFDGFDTAYVDTSPEGVNTGGGGLPATPYVPNPTSPGPGSMNATDQAEAPEGFGEEPSDQFGSGVGHALQPRTTSEQISAQTLGSYQLGRSTG